MAPSQYYNSQRTMSLFKSDYYKINRFFLLCTGHWPYQNSLKNNLLRILGYTSLTIAVIPMMARIYVVSGDLDATLDCLPSLFIGFTSFSKTTIYILKQRKLRELLDCIENDWKIWSSGPELEILKTYAEEGRALSVLFTGNVYLTLSTFITMSLTPVILDILAPLNETRPKQMVYPVELFIDYDKNYNWILPYTIVTALCNMTIILACESMYAVTTQHACGLFAIISYRLRNAIEEMDFKRTNQKQENDAIYEYMTFSIERHNHAIRFTGILESLYSPFLFFSMGFNMIETSIVGLQTVLALGDIDRTIKYGAFAAGMIIHTFLLSLPAERLTAHSTAVARDVYDGNWYLMPIKAQKLLQLIIMEASVPCSLTALKFFPVNMISFSAFLKTSFTYFTVLSTVRT